MASQSPSQRLHPLLLDLQLASERHASGKRTKINSCDVLQYLLETNGLSEEAVRSAYRSLTQQQQQKQSPQKKDSDISSDKKKALDSALLQNYRRRHIALQFYYDGAKYTGLAQNVGLDSDQSVERALFQALQKAHLVESRETSGYSRCGRTDKGVSAAGQVVALNLKSAFSPEASYDEDGTSLIATADLPRNAHDTITVWAPSRKGKMVQKSQSEYAYDKILNNLLPDDIRVVGWTPVSDDFSARFSATTRVYRYFFCQSTMNLDRVRQGLDKMVGTHDFRNFCKMDVEKVYNFERQIHSAQVIEKDDNVCYLLIVGQAFLWHQIRCIASVLFLIGQGLEAPSIVSELLDIEKHPGKPSYPLAPERPLVLHHCGYPNLSFGYSTANLWHVHTHLEQQWQDLILAAARIRNCQEKLSEYSVLVTDLRDFVSAKLKLQKKKSGATVTSTADADDVSDVFSSKTVLWSEALQWMKDKYDLIPDPLHANKDVVYIPMLERSKGTTYEEKVASLGSKRLSKFEENVVKKRKTKEEDQAFYEHMTKQGGSAI